MELKKSWILMMNWTSGLQILHSNAQPNEFKDMQLTWKILIVFYQSLNEDKDKLYYTLETKT